MTTLVQAIISLASGLGGALVGGLIAMKTSRDSIEASFRHQMTLEDVRYRQKIELEVAQRQREAAALRRSLMRSLRRLHNTSRMSRASRSTLESWAKAAEVLRENLENPLVDALLPDAEYEALWKAADEARAAALILRVASEGARQGKIVNPVPIRASVELYRESLRDAFAALSEEKRVTNLSAALAEGISGCGLLVSTNEVFYAILMTENRSS